MEWLEHPGTLTITGLAAAGAVVISIYQILTHLRNYTEPTFQRYIVRIIFLVPCYATASWFSLVFRQQAIWFDTIRDCYEAWVLYNFMALCLAYVGGPGAVVVKAEGKIVEPSWSWGTCCLPPMPVDGFFLRRCKQGTLQFVIIKPLLAALTLVLYSLGKYEDGNWTPTGGYLYISIVYNVCYTLALYALLLFFIGTEEYMEPFHPLLKFILVKSVIFLTFWQGIAISVISEFRDIDAEDGKAIQNLLICIEMLISAAGMLFAFPASEFKAGGATQALRWTNIKHALSIRDVFADVNHQFAPTYQDYVLYDAGTGGGAVPNAAKLGKPKKNPLAFGKAFAKGFGRGGKGPSIIGMSKMGKSEHIRASMLQNMERGAVDHLAPVPEDAVENENMHAYLGKPKKQKGLARQVSWDADANKNTMQMLDSDSDNMDSEVSDNMLEMMDGSRRTSRNSSSSEAYVAATSSQQQQREQQAGWSNINL